MGRELVATDIIRISTILVESSRGGGAIFSLFTETFLYTFKRVPVSVLSFSNPCSYFMNFKILSIFSF